MAAAAGRSETLADLGEWELIRRLGAFAPPGQFADDAALLLHPAGPTPGIERSAEHEPGSTGSGALVINTDVLVEGLHFSDATTAAADVGWRAAAANLSDLAAMGCTEVVGLTVGLVAPGSTPWSWVEGVYEGLREALDAYGGMLLGGDCSGGGQRMLAVSAVGRLPAPPEPPHPHAGDKGGPARDGEAAGNQQPAAAWGSIRRSDGRPGDVLVCTGPHGLSRMGLALLQGELPGLERIGTQLPSSPPSALARQAIEAHQRPKPRFDAVRRLHRSRPDGLPWRVGGCDSSDGLAAAVQAIAKTSSCSARLERRRLPLDPAMASLPRAEAWCLRGGEDFELVLALEPHWAEALVETLPGARVIGQLTDGEAGSLTWSDGTAWPESETGSTGFRHFG